MFSKKHFLSGCLIGLVLLISFLFTLPDGRLHIYFCDVGQGDSVYIRAPDNHDMLIDGGPDEKVLSCLGKYMPFYDRTIDVVVLTHPQKDHLQGLISVVERYTVKYFVIGVEGNNTEGYTKLVEAIEKKKVPIKNLYLGDTFSLGSAKFSVLWPERDWVASHLNKEQLAINNSSQAVLGLSTDTELNSFSYFLHLQYGSFDVLFTGDGDSTIQPEIMRQANLPDIEVLKFPHHGSKTAILPEFLAVVKPELAVISVGRNSYGHPSFDAMDLLKERSIEIKRTDRDGNIEVESDGNIWWTARST